MVGLFDYDNDNDNDNDARYLRTSGSCRVRNAYPTTGALTHQF
ncbi:hypothetical protein [uncultured Thiodictyon sp.]|nr:hypothetical protein [uncultured Thiodictyon sp.]